MSYYATLGDLCLNCRSFIKLHIVFGDITQLFKKKVPISVFKAISGYISLLSNETAKQSVKIKLYYSFSDAKIHSWWCHFLYFKPSIALTRVNKCNHDDFEVRTHVVAIIHLPQNQVYSSRLIMLVKWHKPLS